jgi:hypothetical protein
MKTQTLTQARLKEILNYDPETGVFTWRVSTNKKIKIDSVAGSRENRGYIIIQFEGKSYKAHRLAWLYINGTLSEKQIDHKDRNKSNNAITNLREATYSENQQNVSRARKSNLTSNTLGVSWDKKANKWRAQIHIPDKTINLGVYESKECAHLAYVEAKRQYHPFGEL